MNTKQQYWCSLDEDAFAKEYFSRADGLGKSANWAALSRLQFLARRHFYGALPQDFVSDMPSSAAPNRAGENGQQIEMRVNWLRAHANTKHQIVVAPRLVWGAKAVNTDSKALAGSARGASILEFLYASGKFEAAAISAQLGAVICGEEFIFTPWDSSAGEQQSFNEETGHVAYQGDIQCYQVPSWDVLRDTRAKSFDTCQWVSVRVPVNRWDLIAKHPELEDEIIKTPTERYIGPNGFEAQLQPDSDTVVCHWFFHKRTPALPVGLQAVMLSSDCVLEFGALEKCYWHLPLHRFQAEDLKGTPWGYTSFWEAMGIQDLATDAQGSLASNIVAFAKGIISYEDNQDLNVHRMADGPLMLPRSPGSQPPQPISLLPASPEMFQHLERFKADQRMILGINDMAMGEPPGGPPNAQAWALLSATNVTNNSSEQRNFISGVKSIGTSLLAIVKEKFTEPRKVSIVGVYGADIPQNDSFTNQDFEGIDEVTVTIDNPLLQSAAGRLPIAQMYLDRGFVQSPEQLEQLVITGRLEPMTQVLRNELIHIAYENEQLIQGQKPAVMMTDSHQLHIREHRNPTFAPKGRASAAVIEATNAHIMEHLQMLLSTDPRLLGVLGQAAPPPGPEAQPPPGASGQEAQKGEQAAAKTLGPPQDASVAKAAEVKEPKPPVNPATGEQVYLP